MARTRHQRIILDMDSSESPLYRRAGGAAYNGHFGCVCYHPLFCFNQFGDCEGAILRPGNVHSAERWREVLEPIVERYQKREGRLLFRADAVFARPEVYGYLEPRQLSYPFTSNGTRTRNSLDSTSYRWAGECEPLPSSDH